MFFFWRCIWNKQVLFILRFWKKFSNKSLQNIFCTQLIKTLRSLPRGSGDLFQLDIYNSPSHLIFFSSNIQLRSWNCMSKENLVIQNSTTETISFLKTFHNPNGHNNFIFYPRFKNSFHPVFTSFFTNWIFNEWIFCWCSLYKIPWWTRILRHIWCIKWSIWANINYNNSIRFISCITPSLSSSNASPASKRIFITMSLRFHLRFV